MTLLPRGRRARTVAILGGLATSALALVGWTQPWFALGTAEGTVTAAGDTAAPAVAALALAGLALAAALSLAGPVLRVVFGLLQLAIAIGLGASAIAALVDPVGAAGSAVTGLTGITGAESVGALVTSATPTAWPVVVVVTAVLALAVGLLVLVTGASWPGASRRYSAVRLAPAEGARTPENDWDALSGGDDPTAEPGDPPAHGDGRRGR